MANYKKFNSLGTALGKVWHPPVVAKKAPTVANKLPVATTWVDTVLNDVYFNSGYRNGEPVWINAGGGSGVFSSLTVNPGPTVLMGDVTTNGATFGATTSGTMTLLSGGLMNITSGSAGPQAMLIETLNGGIDIVAAGAIGEDITIQNTGGAVEIVSTQPNDNAIVLSASAGGVHIVAAQGAAQIEASGLASIVSSANTAQAILLNAEAGGVDIFATGTAGEDIDIVATGSSVNITSTENDVGAIYIRENAGASGRIRLHADQSTRSDSVFLQSDGGGITLQAAVGGGVSINAVGNVQVAPVQATSSAGAASVTVNARVFTGIFTGSTTAAGATAVFTVNNNTISATSSMLYAVTNQGSNDAQMTVQRAQMGSSNIAFTLHNNGAAALNGDIVITGWVIQ